jgi:hypothetical protein
VRDCGSDTRRRCAIDIGNDLHLFPMDVEISRGRSSLQ